MKFLFSLSNLKESDCSSGSFLTVVIFNCSKSSLLRKKEERLKSNNPYVAGQHE